MAHICLVLFFAKAKTVTSKRKTESQTDFDREVLFNDEDVDDDAIFKLPLAEQKSRLKELIEKKVDTNADGWAETGL